MKHRKTTIAAVVTTCIGVTTSLANAAPVSSWQLKDFDNDGKSSDFGLDSLPTGNGSNQFAAGAGDGAAFNLDGSSVAPGVITNGILTSGFNFGGTGLFEPNITSGGVIADITGSSLTFSALNFGSQVNGGTQLFLPPDGGPGNNTSTVTSLGGGNFGVVVNFASTVNEPGNSADGKVVNWRLEGVMTTSVVPVPAAAWLFGSGLLGLVGVARRKKGQLAK